MKDFTSGNTIFSEMNAISMAKTSIAGNELFTRKPNDRKPDDNRWNDQNGYKNVKEKWCLSWYIIFFFFQ